MLVILEAPTVDSKSYSSRFAVDGMERGQIHEPMST